MARVLERPTAAPPLPAPGRPTVVETFRGRAQERALLLWNVPLALIAAAGLAMAQSRPAEALVPAALAMGVVWAGCFGLHLLLCLTRFDGDLLLLPLLN